MTDIGKHTKQLEKIFSSRSVWTRQAISEVLNQVFSRWYAKSNNIICSKTKQSLKLEQITINTTQDKVTCLCHKLPVESEETEIGKSKPLDLATDHSSIILEDMIENVEQIISDYEDYLIMEPNDKRHSQDLKKLENVLQILKEVKSHS